MIWKSIIALMMLATAARGDLLTEWWARSWVPREIPGLQLWLDASELPAGAIATWPDKSGNARNATQATATNQPTATAAAMNGRTVARFDGNDYLALSDQISLAALTVAVVWKGSGQDGRLVDQRGTGPTGAVQGWVLWDRRALTTLIHNLYDDGAGNSIGTRNVTVSTTLPNLTVNTYASSEPVYYLNGSVMGEKIQQAGGNLGSIVTTNLIHLGTQLTSKDSQFFTGDMAEVLIWNRVLTTAERQQVEKYLKLKWGTP
jgi:hypothetical protein